MRVRLVLEYNVEGYDNVAQAAAAELSDWKDNGVEVSDILDLEDMCNPTIRVEVVEE